jgi:hypothetical protein
MRRSPKGRSTTAVWHICWGVDYVGILVMPGLVNSGWAMLIAPGVRSRAGRDKKHLCSARLDHCNMVGICGNPLVLYTYSFYT